MKKQSNSKDKSSAALECILGQKSVGYYPVIAKALGSVTAAVMVSQAFFWQYKAKHEIETKTIKGDEYFSKSYSEWFNETSLSEESQKTARKVLVRSGILKECLAGSPATMHFSVDINALVAVINGYSRSGKSVAVDNRNQKRYITRTSSGKFRQLVAVNHGNSYNEESLESLESEREGKHTPEHSENFDNLKEEKKEKAPPVAAHPPAESAVPGTLTMYDPDFPGTTIVEALPESPKQDIVLDPYSHPNARTAMELQERMRAYFMMYPDEWLVNVLHSAKVSDWPEGKTEDCMLKFCLYKEKVGDMKRTFNQFRADLTLWFIDERTRFNRQPSASNSIQLNQKATLNRLGSDAAHYEKPALF